MATPFYAEVSWERMVNAVEQVRRRLSRAAAALERAGVPYAVAGGNAVAARVSRVDEAAGFIHRHDAGIDLFLDGPEAKARDAVHVVLVGTGAGPVAVQAQAVARPPRRLN
jgi:hypothetical protein